MRLAEALSVAHRAVVELHPRAGEWDIDEKAVSPHHHTATATAGARVVASVGGATKAVARRRLVAAIFGQIIVRVCRATYVQIVMDGGPIDIGRMP